MADKEIENFVLPLSSINPYSEFMKMVVKEINNFVLPGVPMISYFRKAFQDDLNSQDKHERLKARVAAIGNILALLNLPDVGDLYAILLAYDINLLLNKKKVVQPKNVKEKNVRNTKKGEVEINE